jgi:type I restriction enzyme R subunit
MTTKLDGEKTFFLPFNQGNGEGVNAGAGNAPCEDDYPVHYMWDDILTKDTILDLISKFIFIQTSEKENEKTGKVGSRRALYFPVIISSMLSASSLPM